MVAIAVAFGENQFVVDHDAHANSGRVPILQNLLHVSVEATQLAGDVRCLRASARPTNHQKQSRSQHNSRVSGSVGPIYVSREPSFVLEGPVFVVAEHEAKVSSLDCGRGNARALYNTERIDPNLPTVYHPFFIPCRCSTKPSPTTASSASSAKAAWASFTKPKIPSSVVTWP